MGEVFTAPEKLRIWQRDEGTCQDCQVLVESQKAAEFHHIVPTALGGDAHNVGNGLLLHTTCHSRNYERLHGRRLHAQRAAMSKKAMRHLRYGGSKS